MCNGVYVTHVELMTAHHMTAPHLIIIDDSFFIRVEYLSNGVCVILPQEYCY